MLLKPPPKDTAEAHEPKKAKTQHLRRPNLICLRRRAMRLPVRQRRRESPNKILTLEEHSFKNLDYLTFALMLILSFSDHRFITRHKLP